MERIPRRYCIGGSVLFLLVILVACQPTTGPVSVAPPPKKVLPASKTPLLANHLPKFLRATERSAPLLTERSHPHGWQKDDCARCHKLAPTATMESCASCHGTNGFGEGPDTCASCHGTSTSDGGPDDPIHVAHLDSPTLPLDCLSCHPDNETDNRHANGSVDLQLEDTIVSVADLGEPVTCADTGCHETRSWSVASCEKCHGYPPKTDFHEAHIKEPDESYRLDILCESCHEGYDHRSGTVDVGGFAFEYDRATGTCTSRCHEEVEKVGARMPEFVATVAWDCEGCHGYPPKSGNHRAHQRELSCAACHANHVHSDAAVKAPRSAPSADIQVALADGGSFDGSICTNACHEPAKWGGRCSSCHGNPPKTGSHRVHVESEGLTCRTCHANNEHDLVVDSGTIDVGGDFDYDPMTGTCTSGCHTESKTWGCTSCHGYPPESGPHRSHTKPSLRYWDPEKLVERSGIPDLATNGIGCEVCHEDHTHSMRAAVAPKDFSRVKVQLASGQFFEKSARCQTACHEPFSWRERCADCHGTPPRTGDHNAHAGAPGVVCTSCHDIEHGQKITDPPHTIPSSGVVTVRNVDRFTGRCTSSCHLTDEGKKETRYWQCSTCHGTPPDTGSHEKHREAVTSCGACHADHSHGIDAVLDPENLSGARVTFPVTGRFDRVTKTCSDIGCHRDMSW